ncbi:hypothetical protein CGC21_25920 [Leishmania donovani]|uniref:Uncharacterized protein n=1 Tax=Leishmania donovani TaxID=5661 RepID=A0A504X1P2_LEIDO|nr:hypothetical protein CGC21_25920 [Leishmania donovani]
MSRLLIRPSSSPIAERTQPATQLRQLQRSIMSAALSAAPPSSDTIAGLCGAGTPVGSRTQQFPQRHEVAPVVARPLHEAADSVQVALPITLATAPFTHTPDRPTARPLLPALSIPTLPAGRRFTRASNSNAKSPQAMPKQQHHPQLPKMPLSAAARQ